SVVNEIFDYAFVSPSFMIRGGLPKETLYHSGIKQASKRWQCEGCPFFTECVGDMAEYCTPRYDRKNAKTLNHSGLRTMFQVFLQAPEDDLRPETFRRREPLIDAPVTGSK